MKEKELVKVMEDFQNKKIDVLIATTIIENGLDLPNVNTLIVATAPVWVYPGISNPRKNWQVPYSSFCLFFISQAIFQKKQKWIRCLKRS